MNTEQSKDRDNEIIGFAHFSVGRAIFRIIGGSIAISLCVAAGLIRLSNGEPLLGGVLFVAGLLMLRNFLDLALSDRIIFYGNRVTKIWHILGQSTIYFSRARVVRVKFSRRPLEWVIRETGPNGERLSMQRPIFGSSDKCVRGQMYG
ncbi:MAG: hypothetical protein WBG50_16785, partial [Desulfomonilaceae bacterium]